MNGFDRSFLQSISAGAEKQYQRCIVDALLNLNERLEKLEKLTATTSINIEKPLPEQYVSGGVLNERFVKSGARVVGFDAAKPDDLTGSNLKQALDESRARFDKLDAMPAGAVVEVPKGAGKYDGIECIEMRTSDGYRERIHLPDEIENMLLCWLNQPRK
jgi:hypothetical protein